MKINNLIIASIVVLTTMTLTGCALVEGGIGYGANKLVSYKSEYCTFPAGVRAVFRAELNKDASTNGAVVIKCPTDKDFDSFVAREIAPYRGANFADVVRAELVKNGSFTFEDGTTVRIVVDKAE